jgi:uncharacterized protein YutE (UPF0331/DUF86 family)
MYFVDREKIEQTLNYLDRHLVLLESKTVWETPVELLALERVTHMVIESILDSGNAIIDGFIMRDPGSYEDIVDILMDEKVVTNEMGTGLKIIVALRKSLVQNYLEIQHDELGKILSQQMDTLKVFSSKVREYLKNELGHVTAFKN